MQCNRFQSLSSNEDNQNDNEELHVLEVSPPKTPCSSNNRNSSSKENVTGKNNGKTTQKERTPKKLPVTVVLVDSLDKNLKG